MQIISFPTVHHYNTNNPTTNMSRLRKNDIARFAATLVELENTKCVAARTACTKCRLQCEQTLTNIHPLFVEHNAKILCNASCGFALVCHSVPDDYVFPKGFHAAMAKSIDRCETHSVKKVIMNDEVACCGTLAIRSYLITGSFFNDLPSNDFDVTELSPSQRKWAKDYRDADRYHLKHPNAISSSRAGRECSKFRQPRRETVNRTRDVPLC